MSQVRISNTAAGTLWVSSFPNPQGTPLPPGVQGQHCSKSWRAVAVGAHANGCHSEGYQMPQNDEGDGNH